MTNEDLIDMIDGKPSNDKAKRAIIGALIVVIVLVLSNIAFDQIDDAVNRYLVETLVYLAIFVGSVLWSLYYTKSIK